jgi:hypothetical protein
MRQIDEGDVDKGLVVGLTDRGAYSDGIVSVMQKRNWQDRRIFKGSIRSNVYGIVL